MSKSTPAETRTRTGVRFGASTPSRKSARIRKFAAAAASFKKGPTSQGRIRRSPRLTPAPALPYKVSDSPSALKRRGRPPNAKRELLSNPSNLISPRAPTKKRRREEEEEETSAPSAKIPRTTSKMSKGRSPAKSPAPSYAASTASSRSKSKPLKSNTTTPPKKRDTPILPPPPPVDCLACADSLPLSSSIKLRCRHYFCKPCLVNLLSLASAKESSFPPKCCRFRIPRPVVEAIFNKKQLQKYDRAEAEFTTKAEKRVYCVKKGCGLFIPPKPPTTITSVSSAGLRKKKGKIRKDVKETFETEAVLKCGKCKTSVCATCKKRAHPGVDCLPDEADESLRKLLALAEASSWRRCPKCKTMAEKAGGCNEMECTCGITFCYVCGEAFKYPKGILAFSGICKCNKRVSSENAGQQFQLEPELQGRDMVEMQRRIMEGIAAENRRRQLEQQQQQVQQQQLQISDPKPGQTQPATGQWDR